MPFPLAVAVCENDVSLMRLDPPCGAFEHVWAIFQQYQRDLGGDALIGVAVAVPDVYIHQRSGCASTSDFGTTTIPRSGYRKI